MQFLIHIWHPSCYYCYKHGDKSCMRIGSDCDYDKHNMFVVICDTGIPVKLNDWASFFSLEASV